MLQWTDLPKINSFIIVIGYNGGFLILFCQSSPIWFSRQLEFSFYDRCTHMTIVKNCRIRYQMSCYKKHFTWEIWILGRKGGWKHASAFQIKNISNDNLIYLITCYLLKSVIFSETKTSRKEFSKTPRKNSQIFDSSKSHALETNVLTTDEVLLWITVVPIRTL